MTQPTTTPEMVERLTEANRAALLTLPLPGPWRDRVRIGVYHDRPYSSTWRKSSKHYDSMVRLADMGLVERTESRGETLWRLTRPLGTDVRAALQDDAA